MSWTGQFYAYVYFIFIQGGCHVINSVPPPSGTHIAAAGSEKTAASHSTILTGTSLEWEMLELCLDIPGIDISIAP